jgi:hypothetical protein|tara:strand:- start:1357 stop:1497 length:141 start_codon:yes stop_codon:yes gene_type:complete
MVVEVKIRHGELVPDRILLEGLIPDGFERVASESKDVFRISVFPDA